MGGAKFLQGLQSNGSISVDCGASGNGGAIHLGNAAHRFAMHISAANTVGLYDQTYSKWMLSCDSSGNVIYAGGSVSASLTIPTTEAATRYFRTYNNTQDLAYGVWSDGTAGIWDYKNNKWLIKSDTSYNITLNGNADRGNYLANYNRPTLTNSTTGRLTAGNIASNNKGGVRTWLATSDMTDAGRPGWDGHILHFDWDNGNAWAAQLAIGTGPKLAIRSQSVDNGVNWTDWAQVYTTANPQTTIQSTVVNNTPSNAYSAIPFTQTSLTASGAKTFQHTSAALGFMASSTAAGTEGYAILVLGNNIAQATANNKRARLRLYGNTTYYHDIYAGTSAQTGNISLTLPNGASGGWLVGAAGAGVGGTAAPVYVNSSGVVTACKVNASGSWHNNGLAVQTGAALEMGKYIDFHEATSTNDYDARISSSLTGLWISTKNAQVVGNENLRNIKAATTDLTAGSSALNTGTIYLVYE